MSAAPLPLPQDMQSLRPQRRANGSLSRGVSSDPRVPLFRGRELKLRGGQRFSFKASKIKRLLTRIAKAERVTIKPTGNMQTNVQYRSCLLLLPAHTDVLSPVSCKQEVRWTPEHPAVLPPAPREQEVRWSVDRTDA